MSANRLIAHPLLSLVLLVLWLWLNSTVALGHLLLASALAIAIPYVADRFLPPIDNTARLAGAAAFAWLVLRDIVAANLSVARLVLGPPARLRPAFVIVPLDLERGWAVTLLASTVSLTPGTVSAEVSQDRRRLLVHALTHADGEDLASHIKTRYERPILELSR